MLNKHTSKFAMSDQIYHLLLGYINQYSVQAHTTIMYSFHRIISIDITSQGYELGYTVHSKFQMQEFYMHTCLNQLDIQYINVNRERKTDRDRQTEIETEWGGWLERSTYTYIYINMYVLDTWICVSIFTSRYTYTYIHIWKN